MDLLEYRGPKKNLKHLYCKRAIENHIHQLTELYPNLAKRICYIAIQGSQNYNLDTYTETYRSDVDTKAIYLPSLEDIVMNREPVSKTIHLKDNEQVDIKDIRSYVKLIKKQNLSLLETLVTEYYMADYNSGVEELRALGNKIHEINPEKFMACISGMSKEKLHALEKPFESKRDIITQYGYDGKQLHHIIRLNSVAKLISKGSTLGEAIKEHQDPKLLNDAKLNKLSLEEARRLSELYDQSTYEVRSNSKYQEGNEAITIELDEMLYRIMVKNIKKEIDNEKV